MAGKRLRRKSDRGLFEKSHMPKQSTSKPHGCKGDCNILFDSSLPALQVFCAHEVPAVSVQDLADGLVKPTACQSVGANWTLELVLPHTVWGPEDKGPLEEGMVV